MKSKIIRRTWIKAKLSTFSFFYDPLPPPPPICPSKIVTRSRGMSRMSAIFNFHFLFSFLITNQLCIKNAFFYCHITSLLLICFPRYNDSYNFKNEEEQKNVWPLLTCNFEWLFRTSDLFLLIMSQFQSARHCDLIRCNPHNWPQRLENPWAASD